MLTSSGIRVTSLSSGNEKQKRHRREVIRLKEKTRSTTSTSSKRMMTQSDTSVEVRWEELRPLEGNDAGCPHHPMID